MMMRGVRGATTADTNNTESILEATSQLLQTLIELNGIDEDDVASVLFTTTPDLTACYPARAARDLGWQRVALLGFQEANVDNGLTLCIRVLIHWNTDKRMDDIRHVFLKDAQVLRPDLSQATPLQESHKKID